MIEIACNIDKNFIEHCAVTLVSIYENNKRGDIRVHIVSPGDLGKGRAMLERLTADYGNKICFYEPRAEMLEGFTIKKFGKRITLATYYRLMLAELLPASIDRVLYLDCDIVVRGSLEEFWNTTLEGRSAACIKDIGSDELSRYDILKYPAEDGYFNAGVMLVNLDYWRTHGIWDKCLDYYRKYPERIRFNDQDLLNCVLHDTKVFVPLKWNMQDGFYRYGMDKKAASPAEYLEKLRNPVILHYTNRKPWDYDAQHPLRHEYFRYLALVSPNAGRLSAIDSLKRFVKLLPYKLGLRKPKYLSLGGRQ